MPSASPQRRAHLPAGGQTAAPPGEWSSFHLTLIGAGRRTPLERASAAAALCGVTRLADVTGLDFIGLPVFQAIRPWGRALSVHQGKGLTPDAAKIGAFMEAVESHCAEAFSAEPRECCFDTLSPNERAPTPSDFSADRQDAPDGAEPLPWVAARRVTGGGTLWVPFDVVSLDFTREGDRRLDRSSVGLGAHFEPGPASTTAILEVIERDADRAWGDMPVWRRSSRRLDPVSIPFPWFESFRDRLRSRGLLLAVFHLPAVIAVPAFMCEITEPGAEGAARHRVGGSAAHPDPERALAKSVAEAAQSRLTVISGARDDIYYPAREAAQRHGIGLGLPLPPGVRPLAWEAVVSAFAQTSPLTPCRCATLLAEAGYPDTAIIDLSLSGLDAVVVKAVVPGLGAFDRRRRPTGPDA